MSNFRHAREGTSSGQGQALWTFFIAAAVSIFLLIQFTHTKDSKTSSPSAVIASDIWQSNSNAQSAPLPENVGENASRTPNHQGGAPQTEKVVQ